MVPFYRVQYHPAQWSSLEVSHLSLPLSLNSFFPLLLEMNGDVDWKTLGNILVAHLLGEVIKILNSLSNLPLGRHDGSTGAWIF